MHRLQASHGRVGVDEAHPCLARRLRLLPFREALPTHHEALLRHLREELLVEVASPVGGDARKVHEARPRLRQGEAKYLS